MDAGREEEDRHRRTDAREGPWLHLRLSAVLARAGEPGGNGR
jgi:hypothetical protein